MSWQGPWDSYLKYIFIYTHLFLRSIYYVFRKAHNSNTFQTNKTLLNNLFYVYTNNFNYKCHITSFTFTFSHFYITLADSACRLCDTVLLIKTTGLWHPFCLSFAFSSCTSLSQHILPHPLFMTVIALCLLLFGPLYQANTNNSANLPSSKVLNAFAYWCQYQLSLQRRALDRKLMSRNAAGLKNSPQRVLAYHNTVHLSLQWALWCHVGSV